MWLAAGLAVALVVLLCVLLRALWRRLACVLAGAGALVFALGWYRTGGVSVAYSLAAAALVAMAALVRWWRGRERPEPMTPERLCSIVAQTVEVKGEADRRLLHGLCAAEISSPGFRDHWNAEAENAGKPTSQPQRERIRELGYTGKIPKNMRAASALIEVLKIARKYNAARAGEGAKA